MNKNEQKRPTFAEHMAEHERYERIAEQILDLYDNHDLKFSNYSRPLNFIGIDSLRDGKVDINFIVYWSGETERGEIRVPAEWFDHFDAAMVESYVKNGAEEAKRLEEQRAAEASARLRQRELEAAMATVKAAGFELHVPLKKD